MIISAVKHQTNPKKFESRTATARHRDRRITVGQNITHFGLQLPQLGKKKLVQWAQLPAGTPEDLSSKELIAAQKKNNKGKDKHQKFVTVQEAASAQFPDFIKALGTQATAGYEDTHASALSNGAKPDQTHPAVAAPATPALVRFLGDLKKRRHRSAFTAEEKEHVVGFALQWLEMEPARAHFFVYLTDLTWFQLFKVEQSNGAILESPVLPFGSTGQQWLAALFLADDETIGFPDIRLPKFDGTLAQLEKFLGQGSTSLVYSDEQKRAVKIFKGSTKEAKAAASKEFKCLADLNRAFLVKKLELYPHVRKMIPKGHEFQLSNGKMALRYPRVGEPSPAFSSQTFSCLVDFLSTLHRVQTAHRDMRPDNLISYEADVILPIDFGSLCELDKKLPYHGTLHYASDAVLDQLDQKTVKVTAADDLVTLVRCARHLVNVDDDFAGTLCALDKPSDIKQFWGLALEGPGMKLTYNCHLAIWFTFSFVSFCVAVWAALLKSAKGKNYKQLKIDITALNLNTPRTQGLFFQEIDYAVGSESSNTAKSSRKRKKGEEEVEEVDEDEEEEEDEDPPPTKKKNALKKPATSKIKPPAKKPTKKAKK
jgi:serine/threonine protein kinase